MVDFVIRVPMTEILGADTMVWLIPWHTICELIGWIAAVLFAYVTNKIWVFCEKDWSARKVAKELTSFAGGRVLTFLIQTGLMVLLIDFLHADAFPHLVWGAGLIGASGYFAVSMMVAVIVIVLNYIFSKLFVFGKKKEN